MNILKTINDCYVIPTRFGMLMLNICKPLFWLSKKSPRIYKFIYTYLLWRKNWYAHVVFIRIKLLLDKNK